MYFSEENLSFEIKGVHKISRGACFHESYDRQYSVLSIRLMGNSDFFFGDNTYAVSSRDVLYIPHSSHYRQATETETVIAIHFITYNNVSSHIEVYRFEDIAKVRKTFEEIYMVWEEKKQGYKYIASSLFYQLIYLLNLSCIESSQTNSIYLKIKPACDYLHQNYKNGYISISSLAKMTYMSETAFRKNFKKVYLVSPNRYMSILRLENASALLQSDEYNVTEAATLSGFDDVKYFSRSFRKHYGISPREYQLKHKK